MYNHFDMENLTIGRNNQDLNFFKYTTQDGSVCIDVLLIDKNVWLTQKNMAALFGVKVNTINYHIKRLKIKNNSTIRKTRIVQTEGKRKIERDVDFYNFDTVMYLGFQINSESANDCREWFVAASKRHLVKGFVMDDVVEIKKDNPSKIAGKNRNNPISYFLDILLYFLAKIKKKLSTLY